jgi:hypothetical protein
MSSVLGGRQTSPLENLSFPPISADTGGIAAKDRTLSGQRFQLVAIAFEEV